MTDDTRMQLQEAHREALDKYTYFLLAGAGAAIGFALNQTHDVTLSWSKLPLGVAVLCWGLSFYFGCRHTSMVIEVIHRTYHFESMRPRLDPTTVEEILYQRNNYARKAGRNQVRQFGFLIAGAVLYIFWQILEMALRTWPAHL